MAQAKKSFLVIGMGRFGTSVARTLMSLEQEVLCVDRSGELISAIADEVTQAIVADASDERVLTQLGVSNFDCIVVAIGNDLRSSIWVTMLCREQGAKRIVAKANDSLHAKMLTKVGADMAILPERESGKRLAHSLVHASVLEFIELSDQYSMTEMLVPPSWVNKTVRELDIHAKYQVILIAVKRDEILHLTLDANFRLLDGDILVVLGANDSLHRVETL